MDDLTDFDFSEFWEESDYARKTYVHPAPSEQDVAAIEENLGVSLPRAYVSLAMSQNGGCPVNTRHGTATPTSWAEDHVALNAIYALGFGEYGLCGEMGSRFWVDEWGYPEDLIYFADCPSAGHDMIALDYRASGPKGEPGVVHVDQEDDYAITELAPDFASFIRGLKPEEAFPI